MIRNRHLRAAIGMLGFIALPFGDTAARLALWLKGDSDKATGAL